MVPKNIWDSFYSDVEDKFGSVEGVIGRESEKAMKEYVELDSLEDKIDRLVQAAGRRPSDLRESERKEKNFPGPDPSETVRVSARVSRQVKQEFTAIAKDSDNSYGYVFARALVTYLKGGRVGRMERKLDRVVDDAESLLGELNDDSDEKLSAVEKRTIKICNNLTERFTEDDLREAITEAGFNSEPTIKKYRQRVLERLNVEPHPVAEVTIWMPAEEARELAPDGIPDVIRKPPQLLDYDEQVRRLQLAMMQKAAESKNGKHRALTVDLQTDALNDEYSETHVRDLMRDAANWDGFSTMKNNSSKLVLSTNIRNGNVTDEDLANEAREYINSTDKGQVLLSGGSNTEMSDFQEFDDPTQAPQQMDTLANAATDGGLEED